MKKTALRSVLIEGAPTADWWERQGETLANAFVDQMRLGLSKGDGLSDLIRRVRGSRESGFADGIMRMAYTRAEGLVRSSVHAVANRAHLDVYEDPSSGFASVWWTALLEARTCGTCAALDGLGWTLPDYEPIGHKVEFPGESVHYSCRCFQTPARGTKSPNALRVSEDGKATRATFAGWLKSKPAEFQDEMLGVGKAKLFRKGLLGLHDLVDAASNPLTLAELKARYE